MIALPFAWLVACGSDAGVAADARPDASAEAAVASAGEPYGAYPFCEPSAALRLDERRVIVADNEGRPPADGEDERPTLWIVPADLGAEPVPVRRAEAEQDVEALVAARGELWLVGSMSRNKDCETKGKRWSIHVAGAGWERDVAGATWRVLERGKKDAAAFETDPARCADGLFGGVPGAAGLCAAAAARGCGAFDVEGAVAVDERVWLGLRAPVVEGRAALVRVAPEHDRLAFDAIAWVDLGGLGIRELTAHGDRVHGIAGAADDAATPARWFSFAAADLAAGVARPDVHDATLPASTEALWIDDRAAWFLVDGSTGDGACVTPARAVRRTR